MKRHLHVVSSLIERRFHELLMPNLAELQPTKTPDPVPATVIFGTGACPLYLPELDNFLSNLPAKTFPPYASNLQVGNTNIFPPMDLFMAAGKSLKDLENNNVVPPTWRNRNSIFGALVNIVLGITVSDIQKMPGIWMLC